jgi:DUF4097 and DUF4098 domain-containing protein YvlB
MPSYETPEPISVTLELAVGRVRIQASDRTDTIVQILPSDEADESDVKAAEQVRVEFANGTLRIIGPKSKTFDFSRNTRSVDVTIELPSGSQVSAHLQAGNIRTAGRLGACDLKTSVGNIWLERTGALHLATSVGDVTADVIAGDAEVSTSSGRVQLGKIEGTAVIKNSNGDTEIDAVGGDLRVRSANGHIRIDHAGAGVDLKTSNGSIRVGEVVRGSVVVGTALGDLDIGIAEGTAAWLEMNTSFGHVRNLLEPTSRPAESDETVEVRGRTSYGDITVRRS